MYHLTEAYLMAALVCIVAAYLGALLFGSSVVAPLVVRVLGDQIGGPLLRAYWPRYHGFAVSAGLLITLVIGVGSGFSAVPGVYAMLVAALAGLMTLVFYFGARLIPAINAARDEGRAAAFARLHRLDVMLVGVGMLLALMVLVALIYVLPGQFTFWPGV